MSLKCQQVSATTLQQGYDHTDVFALRMFNYSSARAEFDACDQDENVNKAAAVQCELGSDSASLHHPTDECSCGETY
jgi:uncharacterized protein (DUF924 family)